MIRYLLFILAVFAGAAHSAQPVYEGQMAAGCNPVITFKHQAPSVSELCSMFMSDLKGPANNCPSPTPAGNISLTGSTEQRCYFHGRNESDAPWDLAAIISHVCADGTPIKEDGTCEESKCPMYNGTTDEPLTAPAGCTCPAGTKFYPGGCRKQCGPDQPAGADVDMGWDVIIPKGQVDSCYKGCLIQHKSGVFYTLKNGSTMASATYTGWACKGNGDGTPPAPQPQPDNKGVKESDIKPPVCGPTDGVMTSSSGAVKCVPEGTPDASKPVVKKETKNETFPDGSTKQTETTKTKDPNTGAEDTQTKTTTGPASSGGAGQAGPVGTGTSSGNTSGNNTPGSGTGGNGTGGNCEGENCGDDACDPTLNFCGGPKTEGIYTKKEKTVEGPLQAFASGVRSSLLGTSVTGFFTVNIPSGGCPSWSVDVPYLKTRVDISQYMCSGAAVSAMDIIGSVLMVVAAFAAFRWAML